MEEQLAFGVEGMVMRFRGARLAFVAVLLLLTLPFVAEAQQAGKVYQLGYLSLPPIDTRLDRFRQGLRDLNFKSARALQLSIPQSLLLRADQIID